MKSLAVLAAAAVLATTSGVLAAPAASSAPNAVSTGTTASPVVPAAATAPRLSNFADLIFSGTTGESAPEVNADFTAGATLGGAPLVFEKTRLDDLMASYGGTIHSQGDAGNAVSWLCYTRHARHKTDTPETVWFTSTGEIAGGGHTLSMLAVENVDAGKVSGCLTAPKGFAFPSFGVPAVGSTFADLKARFATLHKDRQGNVYFDSARPLNDGSGASVYQTLGYRLNKKDKVLAIAVTQVTTH
ncbi:MAG: hypothetical protein P4M09_20230 [Devosia sp.]|nr:hypothetical protein [Devosia sp.]